MAFAAGYVPQKWALRDTLRTLETTRNDRELGDLHRRLGVAALAAQRLDMTGATTSAVRFFDDVRSYLTTHPMTEEPRTRIALESYLRERDTIMAGLAQGDPTAGMRLGDLYLTMDQVLKRRQAE